MSILVPSTTHVYEFSDPTMYAEFGAGWTLTDSNTQPTFFRVGSEMDDIVNEFNRMQSPEAHTVLSKGLVPRQVEYTRLLGSDTVTIQYPTLTSSKLPIVEATGSLTTAELNAFKTLTPGAAVSGWSITTSVNHALLTLTTQVNRMSAAVNPRFLSGYEAIDYLQVPAPNAVRHPAPHQIVPPVTFTATPQGGATPLVVAFTDTTIYDPKHPAVSWHWDFGDGGSSTLQNPPPYTYSRPGVFLVRLIVTNAVGNGMSVAQITAA